MNFFLPSRTTNAQNEERRAGFEFEFSGLTTEGAAGVIMALWGGSLEKKNRFDVQVKGTRLGDFSVALDARTIQNEKYLEFLKAIGVETAGSGGRAWWEDLIENIASFAIPYEIGMPPLPFSHLEEAEKLRQALQEKNAQGTKAKYQYAFGMHINPEVPDESPETILNILRSFLIHYPWLCEELKIDLARRITPFINAFPDDYAKKILDPDYRADRSDLIRDYLEANPTRNRPLDMLPLFCRWDEQTVRRAMPEEKIKPRPTFHYRMPNCLLDDSNWRVARDWNYWVRIEELAGDRPGLGELGRALRDEMDKSPLTWETRWAEFFQKQGTHA